MAVCGLKYERKTSTGLKAGGALPAEEGVGVQSSKACSRSYVTKLELLSSRYMSLGLVHLMVFWCGDIHAASLGAVQFSFGATAPPSSAILSLIV